METEGLNVAAVVAGAVLGFAWGMVLYHPRVMGRRWAEGSGVALEGGPPALAFALQAVALLALAAVVGMTATVNFLGTAILAIVAAAAFVVGGGAFRGASAAALITDAAYVIGAGILMIVMQGVL